MMESGDPQQEAPPPADPQEPQSEPVFISIEELLARVRWHQILRSPFLLTADFLLNRRIWAAFGLMTLNMWSYAIWSYSGQWFAADSAVYQVPAVMDALWQVTNITGGILALVGWFGWAYVFHQAGQTDESAARYVDLQLAIAVAEAPLALATLTWLLVVVLAHTGVLIAGWWLYGVFGVCWYLGMRRLNVALAAANYGIGRASGWGTTLNILFGLNLMLNATTWLTNKFFWHFFDIG